jgi:hypothetical protein
MPHVIYTALFKKECRLIQWSGIATVVRAISSVMIAEVLLAFFLQGYSDSSAITLILIISILLMLIGSYNSNKKGSKNGPNME